MRLFLSVLPAILCVTLLIPSAMAVEVTEPSVFTEGLFEEEYLDFYPLEETTPTEATETVPETTAPTEVPEYTEPTETVATEPEPPQTESTETEPTEIPMVTEETTVPDLEESLAQLVESQQNTEYSVQLLAGFGTFFVICVLCYFCYKFFKIFF